MFDVTNDNGTIDGMEILERQWKEKVEERDKKIAELEARNEENINWGKIAIAAAAVGGIALGSAAANSKQQKRLKKAYNEGVSDGVALGGIYIDGYKEGQQTLIAPLTPTVIQK